MSSVNPSNILPSHAMAFLGPHASIKKHGRHIMQQRRGRIQIERFFLRSQDSVAAMFTSQELDPRSLGQNAPLLGQPQDSAQATKAAIHGTNLKSITLPF